MPLSTRRIFVVYPLLFVAYATVIAVCSPGATTVDFANAYRWGVLTILFSNWAALGSIRVLTDTYEWRLALHQESERATLALERTRIARDLHDHIGARLTGIALRAEREQKRAPNDAKDALIWIQDTVRLCLEELRDTIRRSRAAAATRAGPRRDAAPPRRGHRRRRRDAPRMADGPHRLAGAAQRRRQRRAQRECAKL